RRGRFTTRTTASSGSGTRTAPGRRIRAGHAYKDHGQRVAYGGGRGDGLMREKIAIVFMTLSAVATLVLGGAVVHELGKKATVQTAVNAPAATSSQAATSGTGATAGTQATQGKTITSGGTQGTQVGNLSTSSTGVSHGVITVGGVYDETGPFDATVERDTVRAYFNMINAQGGVNGYKFQLRDCDSAYDPTQAHQCAQQMVSQGVLAIV